MEDQNIIPDIDIGASNEIKDANRQVLIYQKEGISFLNLFGAIFLAGICLIATVYVITYVELTAGLKAINNFFSYPQKPAQQKPVQQDNQTKMLDKAGQDLKNNLPIFQKEKEVVYKDKSGVWRNKKVKVPFDEQEVNVIQSNTFKYTQPRQLQPIQSNKAGSGASFIDAEMVPKND